MKSGPYLAKLRNEQGMALLLSLLILVAAAVVALSLGLETTLETRIADNQRLTAVAFFNAETGIAQARVLLAEEFGTAPANLAKMRSGQEPDWGFLFPNGATTATVNLNSSSYQVTAINPGYPGTSSVPIITLQSIGYGPGGAEQVVEESVSAQANGAESSYYAQQGGGSSKANVNDRETGAVDTNSASDAVDTGGTIR